MSQENENVEGVAETKIPVEYEGSIVIPGAKRKRTRSPKVDDKLFITAWQGGASVQEVADSLGLKKTSCNTKAVTFRKLGIELKKMPRGPRGGQQRDVEALKAHLASLVVSE